MHIQFLVWVGEEDHLRIISMQEGGHVGEVFARLVQGVQVHIAGSTHGGDIRQARPGGPGTPTSEHTWGRYTPGSSRGSRYTYRGTHVGEM